MTGHGSAVGALDAVSFGAYDYLMKPFEVKDVQRILVQNSAVIKIKPQQNASLESLMLAHRNSPSDSERTEYKL